MNATWHMPLKPHSIPPGYSLPMTSYKLKLFSLLNCELLGTTAIQHCHHQQDQYQATPAPP